MNDQTRVPNLAIRKVRELERQESRSEFAEALKQKARELGESVSPSERYVARLEDGDIKYPHPVYRRVLTELCGRSIMELGFAVPGQSRGAHHDQSVIRPTVLLFDREDEPEPTVLSQGQIEAIRLGLEQRIAGAPIASAEIDDWELTALRHAQATRYREPGILLADLMADLTDLSSTLSLSRSATAVRRLTRVIAQMSGLVCLMYVKLGDRTAFRKWARTARVAAEEAGDPFTIAWIRAHESYGYYYSGDMFEAINVARHAQYVAKNTPCVGSALAAALEARALASLGPNHAEDAQAALRRAEVMLGSLESSDMVPSALGYTEAQLRFHEGNTYTHLHDTRAAWTAQKRALELAPDGDYTDRTLTHLDRATCLAHDGDSRNAVAYAAEILSSLTEEQRRGIITSRAQEIVLALPSSDRALPAVQEFHDLLVPSE